MASACLWRERLGACLRLLCRLWAMAKPRGRRRDVRSTPKVATRNAAQKKRRAVPHNQRAVESDDAASRIVEPEDSAMFWGVDRRVLLGIVGIAVLTVVCYGPAFRAGFVFDDKLFTKDRAVMEWGDIWRIWFSPSYIELEGHYWPVFYSTFWAEHKLWGFAPVGYHIVNVGLHLLNSLLVWRVMAKLRVRAGWLIAAVFAVHPVHVESVAWVFGRKDLLSALFYLAAVLAWLRFEETEERRSYVSALVLLVAALLSKSVAATLPVALLVIAWFKRGRISTADWLRTIPFFAASAVITVADLLYYRSSGPFTTDYTIAERGLAIAPRALWSYLAKLLWPVDLPVIYPHWDTSPDNPWAWVLAVAAVAAGVVLWHLRHRIGRGPLAGAAFFLLSQKTLLTGQFRATLRTCSFSTVTAGSAQPRLAGLRRAARE